jgi:hypothetical protein
LKKDKENKQYDLKISKNMKIKREMSILWTCSHDGACRFGTKFSNRSVQHVDLIEEINS